MVIFSLFLSFNFSQTPLARDLVNVDYPKMIVKKPSYWCLGAAKRVAIIINRVSNAVKTNPCCSCDFCNFHNLPTFYTSLCRDSLFKHEIPASVQRQRNAVIEKTGRPSPAGRVPP